MLQVEHMHVSLSCCLPPVVMNTVRTLCILCTYVVVAPCGAYQWFVSIAVIGHHYQRYTMYGFLHA
ncbi:hypothetical protein SODALDRAFT_106552 [Sodiomyces alkalinus F11]|uniref:Uncharacterized protein n=1 Tax=Sodiomyces alkalinus (strain CBS 110278 / VKM F-3762 / F11) TaxID=1314773 RepID=A0A3N2Q287_SODAK|nr:hypothetical protein SODALDRAFT_106552 [Sodiomyces alkalinus F11]ROT40881.1 hypothetical protein SODALDRAFT_106552 [Sodiomyces alkalinus F11]